MEIPQYLRGYLHDVQIGAERNAFGIFSASHLQVIEIVPDLIVVEFGQDDSLLLIHILFIQNDSRQPVLHYEHGIVEAARDIGRH